MRTAAYRTAAVFAIAIAGCDHPTTQDTANTDVAEDSGTTDVEPDAATDTAMEPDSDAGEPDAEPDTTPPPEEICDDAEGRDEDGDGDANCDDRDCDRACLPDCPEGMVVRGGECTCDPGPCGGGSGPSRGDDWYSFVRSVELPTDEHVCCWDYDGDGEIDSGAARLEQALNGAGVEWRFNDAVQGAIESGGLNIVLEWGAGPNDAGFVLFFATNDVDADGTPDQTFDERAEGAGRFTLPDYPGTDALVVSVADEFERVVTAGPVAVDVPVANIAPTLTSDPTVTIRLDELVVHGPIHDGERGRSSVDVPVEGESERTIGGIQVGAYIRLEAIAETLNALASACSCAGVDPLLPVFEVSDAPAYLQCGQPVADGCDEDAPALCQHLPTVCDILPTVAVADIYEDRDPSLSIGLRLSLAEATVSNPPPWRGE